jgi:hypothetical protein
MTCALFRSVLGSVQRANQTRKEFNMARNNTSTASEPKAPDFLAWHVANKGDKAYWTKVGAAWFHRDHKGLTLQLEVIPINGRITLRTPLEDTGDHRSDG